MLTEQEAQDLMKKLIDLKEKVKNTNENKYLVQLKNHERICISKFKYLITMKTNRYKLFSNYDDLNQDGYEALVKAMNNYNPKLGSFFWWAHKYIDTRISRCANLHTTIRYPLKIAKKIPPHKENVFPILIEENNRPDKEFENHQIMNNIESSFSLLTQDQKDIINLAYGFDGCKPMTINKICKKLNISRSNCLKMMNSALSTIKDSIRI